MLVRNCRRLLWGQNVTNIILAQNESEFVEKFDIINSKLHHFICYTQDFINGVLASNEELFCFRSKKLEKFEMDYVFRNKTVEIINAQIVLENKIMMFENNENIFISKCNFIFQPKKEKQTGIVLRTFGEYSFSRDEHLQIENCSKIIINDCSFSMQGEKIYTESLINIAVSENVIIDNCKFDNIVMYSSKWKSSFVHCNGIKYLKIDNIYANNCVVKCRDPFDLIGGIIYVESTKVSIIENSKFVDIKLNRYDGNSSYIVNGDQQGMINGISEINNCEVLNSANLLAKPKAERNGFTHWF